MHREQLIEKYLKGQLSEKEFAWLVHDLSQASDRTAYEPLLQRLWEDARQNAHLSPADSQRLRAAFQDLRQASSPPKKRAFLSTKVWYWAAAVTGIVAASVALWLLAGRSQMINYATGYGETRTVTLPDNTIVTLNANSSLRYGPDWNLEQPREVWLDGEAYFSVVHTDNDQQFLVHVTDAFQVEVLGTEFNVKERRNRAEVVLNTGAVRLSVQNIRDGPQTLAMEPGDLVEFSEAGQTLVKKQVDPEHYAAWRDHKMIFNQMPLLEIARRLEDTYGVSITIVGDNLLSTRLTGAFPTHNLEMILTSLPAIMPMKITRNENNIIFQRDQK